MIFIQHRQIHSLKFSITIFNIINLNLYSIEIFLFLFLFVFFIFWYCIQVCLRLIDPNSLFCLHHNNEQHINFSLSFPRFPMISFYPPPLPTLSLPSLLLSTYRCTNRQTGKSVVLWVGFRHHTPIITRSPPFLLGKHDRTSSELQEQGWL